MLELEIEMQALDQAQAEKALADQEMRWTSRVFVYQRYLMWISTSIIVYTIAYLAA